MKFQNSSRRVLKTGIQDADWITKLYLTKFEQPGFVEMTSFNSVYTLLLMVDALTKPATDHNKSTPSKRKICLIITFYYSKISV